MRIGKFKLFLLCLLVVYYVCTHFFPKGGNVLTQPSASPAGNGKIPSYVMETYDGPFVVINNNIPYFDENMLSLKEAEYYSPLDYLGRCGPAYAVVTKQTLPKAKREDISMIRPSGWPKKNRGPLQWQRCHLLGHQLTGENANNLNFITGTQYLNVVGMLPYENKVAKYVKTKNKPVLYRVVPIFIEDEPLARGVTMEGYSLADKGREICFNVFIPNIQPGFIINYKTTEVKKTK